MTNDNYTIPSKEELQNILENLIKANKRWYTLISKKKEFENIRNAINIYTPLLQDGTYTLNTKVYWIINNISEFPRYVCPVDGNVQFAYHINICNQNEGYSKWLNRAGCCHDCSVRNPIVKNKARKTINSHSDDFKKSIQDKISNTKLIRYGSKTYNNRTKAKDTSINRYGVDHYSRTSECKERIQQTNLERRGVRFASQDESIKNKIRETNIKLYGVDNVFKSQRIKDKIKQVNLDKYNVEFPCQSKIIKQKMMNTQKERWGGAGFSSYELNTKSKQTNRKLHGDENYNNREKAKQTSIVKYGVEYYTQSDEYHKNKKHRYHSDKYPGLTFDSNWEVRVYEFCKDNDIPIEYSPSISFEYEYDGRTWIYHPDFLINGKVYEVKGDQFFRINESTGNEEMFCPYRYDDWSDEHYNWMCGKFEAKHQCMIKITSIYYANKISIS